MGRVYVYARVSSAGQEDNTSLSVQATRCKSWCLAQGWTVADSSSDVASGATLDRPALARLRSLLQPGDAVVVLKLDRLSRSVVDLEPLLIEWEGLGVSIHSVSEPIETGTAMGRALLRILIVFAQAEREVITERVLSGKAKNAADGGFNGGPAPFGYRRPNERGQPFEVEPSEAEIVMTLFKRYASGKYGLTRLRALTSCPLSEGGIEGLLSNPTLTGRHVWRGVARPADHEPIISDRLFRRVQKERVRRARCREVRLWKSIGTAGVLELRCEAR